MQNLAGVANSTRDKHICLQRPVESLFNFIQRHEPIHACNPEVITISSGEPRRIQMRIKQHLYSLGWVWPWKPQQRSCERGCDIPVYNKGSRHRTYPMRHVINRKYAQLNCPQPITQYIHLAPVDRASSRLFTKSNHAKWSFSAFSMCINR